jgi:hypothetical protein
MAQYRDTAGRQHVLRITMAGRQRILDRTEWDLLQLAHDPQRLSEFLKALQLDDSLIYEILGAIEQLEPAAIQDVADGTTHEEASAALLEAIADFFPKGSPLKAGLQDLLAKLLEAQETARRAISEQVEAAVQALDMTSMA